MNFAYVYACLRACMSATLPTVIARQLAGMLLLDSMCAYVCTDNWTLSGDHIPTHEGDILISYRFRVTIPGIIKTT